MTVRTSKARKRAAKNNMVVRMTWVRTGYRTERGVRLVMINVSSPGEAGAILTMCSRLLPRYGNAHLSV
jgi:hypothetical protein